MAAWHGGSHQGSGGDGGSQTGYSLVTLSAAGVASPAQTALLVSLLRTCDVGVARQVEGGGRVDVDSEQVLLRDDVIPSVRSAGALQGRWVDIRSTGSPHHTCSRQLARSCSRGGQGVFIYLAGGAMLCSENRAMFQFKRESRACTTPVAGS